MNFVQNPQNATLIWYHGSSNPYLLFEKLTPTSESDSSYRAFYISSDRSVAEGNTDESVEPVPVLNAKIANASFQDADLRGTNLTQCEFSFRDEYFKGAKYDNTTIFPMNFPKQIKYSMTFMDTPI